MMNEVGGVDIFRLGGILMIREVGGVDGLGGSVEVGMARMMRFFSFASSKVC